MRVSKNENRCLEESVIEANFDDSSFESLDESSRLDRINEDEILSEMQTLLELTIRTLNGLAKDQEMEDPS